MPSIGLPPIAAIALGTVIGGLGQIALQWPILHREGFRYRPVLDFRDPELRQILRLMGPGTLGLAAVQINVFVNTYPRDDAATGRGVVAELRVPVDVPPNRIVRSLDRDSCAPRHLAPRGSERQGCDSQDGVAGPQADADAERAGDDRPHCARESDRRVPAATRPFLRRGHGGDGRGADVLRARARWATRR